MITQLKSLIQLSERENELLFVEARGLKPDAAQEYCKQLSQRINELKINTAKQQNQFDEAEKEIRAQNVQNVDLVSSINHLKHTLNSNKGMQGQTQAFTYELGTRLNQKIANPNQRWN